MSNQLFSTLRQAQQANQVAGDQVGRSLPLTLGIVTNIDDPEGKRRIKTTLQAKGGKTETNWLYRLLPHPYDDPPLPRVGQTVGVMFIDGDPHQGVYLGTVTNQPNPERPTDDPKLDDSRLVEGDQIERVERNVVLSVGERLTFQNDAGSKIELMANGDIIIQAAGRVIMTSGLASTLQAKQIAVIGAVDNAGHPLVTSGQ